MEVDRLMLGTVFAALYVGHVVADHNGGHHEYLDR
jgi:hypothetical protein